MTSTTSSVAGRSTPSHTSHPSSSSSRTRSRPSRSPNFTRTTTQCRPRSLPVEPPRSTTETADSRRSTTRLRRPGMRFATSSTLSRTLTSRRSRCVFNEESSPRTLVHPLMPDLATSAQGPDPNHVQPPLALARDGPSTDAAGDNAACAGGGLRASSGGRAPCPIRDDSRGEANPAVEGQESQPANERADYQGRGGQEKGWQGSPSRQGRGASGSRQGGSRSEC